MKYRWLGLLLLLASVAACDKTKPAGKGHEHKDGDAHEHKDGDGHAHKDGDGHEHKEGDGHKEGKK